MRQHDAAPPVTQNSLVPRRGLVWIDREPGSPRFECSENADHHVEPTRQANGDCVVPFYPEIPQMAR
jgi:hypothetical protein